MTRNILTIATALIFFLASVNSFALTPAQLQALRVAINADPALSAQPTNSDGAYAIAEALDRPASPAYIVWRSSVTQDEITGQAGFVWTLVDALSAGSARIWEWMFDNQHKAVNCSAANVRQGIADVWSGNAAKLAVQAVVLTTCKRAATRGEKILATGTGTDVSPAVMGFEGEIEYADIEAAR